ncbi:MAG: thioredoxin family protein [Treponema sp.]|jgi:small redox-active disulfide protein 2|nr:thioredoxin family protein [Treponema sp.]
MENLTVKVYGSGCKGCQTLHQNVIDALAEMNIAANVEYITDLQKVMEAGIMSMPVLSVNEKVVSSGKILGIAEIKKIIEAEQ